MMVFHDEKQPIKDRQEPSPDADLLKKENKQFNRKPKKYIEKEISIYQLKWLIKNSHIWGKIDKSETRWPKKWTITTLIDWKNIQDAYEQRKKMNC